MLPPNLIFKVSLSLCTSELMLDLNKSIVRAIAQHDLEGGQITFSFLLKCWQGVASNAITDSHLGLSGISIWVEQSTDRDRCLRISTPSTKKIFDYFLRDLG